MQKEKRVSQSLKSGLISPRTLKSKFAKFGIQVKENEFQSESKKELNRKLKQSLKFLKKHPRSYYKDFRGSKSSRFFERISQLKDVLTENIKNKKIKMMCDRNQRRRSEMIFTLSCNKTASQR